MLELRPLDSQSNVCGLRRVQKRLSLGNIQPTGHTALMANIRQAQRPLLQVNIVAQDDELLIDVARHDVEGSHIALQLQEHIFVIGHAYLRQSVR